MPIKLISITIEPPKGLEDKPIRYLIYERDTKLWVALEHGDKVGIYPGEARLIVEIEKIKKDNLV